jgi:chitin disaccharide deacetylase
VNEGASESIVIPHVDDVGCSHGANVAMVELARAGGVTCGSVMVPPSWFPDIVQHGSKELDLGIHLTLTSESAAFRWRPLSTASRSSGLLDEHGFMWSQVAPVRRKAVPDAVEGELRAQIDTALAAGIDVTHLDHHMGAALAPEFAAITVRIAQDYRLPLFFPTDIASFLSVLDMGLDLGEPDIAVLKSARRQAGALAVGDSFVMGLTYQTAPAARSTFERLLSDLSPGVTYLSLHCSKAGDIEQVHPNDAAWRIAEYELFSDPDFVAWLSAQPFRLGGMREYRDALAA